MNPPYGGHEDKSIQSFFPNDLASSETADLFLSVIMYRLKNKGRAAVVIPDSFLTGTDSAKVAIKKKLFSEFDVHTIIRLPNSCFAPYTPIATNLVFFEKKGSTKKTWFYRYDLINGQKFSMRRNPITFDKLRGIVEWWNNRIEIQDEKEAESQRDSWKAREVCIKEIEENGYDLGFCSYPIEEIIVLPPEDTINAYIKERDILNTKIDKKLEEIRNMLGV